jgi:hypothetical protein
MPNLHGVGEEVKSPTRNPIFVETAYLVMAQSDPTREIFGHREDVSEEVYLKPIEVLVYG